ncbi:6-bladed beta-propeller [Parabacteroides sp. OttesenSCG-928-G07]|nr:6-bladed beta-propeller [Parabacteroides sp. OttesenSCG-928-G07]
MTISRWKFQILLPTCLLLLGCNQNSKDKTGDIPVIDIVGNLGEYEAIPVSQFVTELEYIPLETNNECFFAEESWELLVTSSHIFVRGFRYCYAFDRNGRFLGQIGNLGKGPGEYSYLTGFSIDEKKQSLYLETLRTLLEYSWDGVFRQSINLPKNIHGSSLRDVSFVRDNLFMGHFRNHQGDLLHNFVLFDTSSKVVKSFDNYVQFNPKRFMTGWEHSSMKPFRLSEHIYVKELANDTLFYLTEQNELVSRFVFDIGEYTSTKEKREYDQANDLMRGILPEGIGIPVGGYLPMIGTQNHLFFGFRTYSLSGKYAFPEEMDMPIITPSGSGLITFQSTGKVGDWRDVVGIYNTANQTTYLLDTDPITRMVGLVNDLDGGLSFWPRYYTSENELVDIWRAEDMKEFLTEKYFAAHEIKDPAAHQKLKELVQKLDIEDNPVIVIAKLKPELIMTNN